MKIVECCPYDMLRPGGVQAHVRDLSSWLRGHGHQVLVVAPPPLSGGSAPDIRHLGRVWRIPIHGTVSEVSRISRRELACFAGEMREWGADLLHIHTPWTPFLPLQVWRRLDLPTVATFHATLPPNAGLLGRAIRAAAGYFLRRVDAAIVPSVSALSTLPAAPQRKAPVVLPPSIDLEPWARAREGRKTSPECLRAVFLGRLEERKGVGVLLDAWRIVSARMPALALTIAGGGALEPAVRAALKTPWGRSITFVKDPDAAAARRLVAEADIFVAPSLYGESFGLVLVEAMAAGAVPVAAANSGYGTVMTGEGSSLLVSPGEAGALAARILSLAANEAERERLRVWGLAHAAGFGIAAVGPAYERLFRSVLGERPVKPARTTAGRPRPGEP